MQTAMTIILLLTIGILLILVGLFLIGVMSFDDDDINSAWPDQDRFGQDPWSTQRSMMLASHQQLPPTPMLTKGGLLYAALMMEEQSETYSALATMMVDIDIKSANALTIAANHFAATSNLLRERLAEMAQFNLSLSRPAAIELLDGITDTAVINCGMAEAFGLPGAKAYAEVQRSNLSKINPVTGVIDKTPDGKWIKGPAFFKPDLDSVMGFPRGTVTNQPEPSST